MRSLDLWKLEKAFNKAAYNVRGLFLGNRVRVYWWSSRKNFGDLMTPALLLKYGYSPVYAKKNSAELLCTGSILDGVNDQFKGKILGSGLIKDHEIKLPKADILAVRGVLTRDRLGLDDSVALGDPGLLAEKLVSGSFEKKYRLGIVPHYMDKNNSLLRALVEFYGGDACLINAESYPSDVVNKIARCEVILSSSLHGVIAAHALGIPAVWIRLSDSVVGNGFKFLDYASSVDIELKPMTLKVGMSIDEVRGQAVLPDHDIMKQRKNVLDKLFGSVLKDAIRCRKS